MKNKKALSGVIAAVLLILVSISAVSLVYVNIRPILLAPQDKMSCVDMKISSIIVIEKSCYNTSSGNLEITLKRAIGSEIKSVDLAISGEDSGTWRIGEGCEVSELPGEGGSKKYYINVENPEEVSVLVSGCFLETSRIENC